MTSLRFKLILLFAELLAPHCADAEVVGVWFSPRGGCTAAIVEQYGKAKNSIDVMAYTFTSEAIADALIAAKQRGVAVRVILDDDEAIKTASQSARLKAAGIKVFLDGEHPIAHNKVSIIDYKLLLGGSFNYSRSAESNAENLYLEDGKATVDKYVENFDHHLQHSKPLRTSR